MVKCLHYPFLRKPKAIPPVSLFGSFQKNKRIKKAGLCHSELMNLKNLWKNANNCQKIHILKSPFPSNKKFATISKNGQTIFRGYDNEKKEKFPFTYGSNGKKPIKKEVFPHKKNN